MRTILISIAGALALASPALAKPAGPTIFCETYPDAPACIGGKPACTTCHGVIPERNFYGAAVESGLALGQPRPLSDADYAAALPSALRSAENDDADNDGFTNFDEILAGTQPGNAGSKPLPPAACDGVNPRWSVCEYDPRYVYKKLHIDFCGRSPAYDAVVAFDGMDGTQQDAELSRALDACLTSDYWRSKDGALWRLAHRKIRPIAAVKSGANAGVIPLGDYDDDYALFAYANSGDHDVRSLLTADFFAVMDTDNGFTEYRSVPNKSGQSINADRRAGMMTTKWSLVNFVMFTSIPRTAAAQAYRSYLNLDIAKLEGLIPVAGEPVDYDAKDVTQPACVVCHSTLDPLSYPFKNYVGLDDSFGTYDPNRLRKFRFESDRILETPEAGVVLGQPVADLGEWAQVAANSDEFARAVVDDFWRLTLGEGPRPDELEAFTALWTGLMTTHDYRVEKMLHDLIRTEAYGVP